MPCKVLIKEEISDGLDPMLLYGSTASHIKEDDDDLDDIQLPHNSYFDDNDACLLEVKEEVKTKRQFPK